MTPKHVYFRVLEAFENNAGLTQRELAEHLGISLGKTNFLINALLEKGAIKIRNFRRSDTKLTNLAYLLTPKGISERLRLTQGYLAAKRTEYEALKAEISPWRKKPYAPGSAPEKARHDAPLLRQ